MSLFILKKVLKQTKITYLDVGASGDLLPRWNKYNDILAIYALEPIYDEFIKLKKKLNKSVQIFNDALSDKEGYKIFYETKGPYQSSFLQPNFKFVNQFPNSDRFNIKKKIKIYCKKLDNFKDNFDFIKIDTQGYNYNVLSGGIKKIKSTLAIEIEAEFVKIYKGQKLFEDTKTFLEKNNFIMIDFLNLRRWSWSRSHILGRLIFGNVLFIKDPIKLLKNYSQYKKLIVILIIYNKLDYASSLSKKLKISDRLEINKLIKRKKVLLFFPTILFSLIFKILRLFNKNFDYTLFP